MTAEEPPEWWDTVTRALLASMPGIGGAAQVIYEDVRAHLAARAVRTLDEIVAESGEDRLRDRLNSDPELEAVFAHGLDAATRTGYEAKRRLLSRVISAAVLDDAKVDEALLIVLALRDLDAPHLRVLEKMRRVEDDVLARDLAEFGEAQNGQEHAQSDRESAAHGAVRASTEGVPVALLESLVRTGVAHELGMSYGGPMVPATVSSFGRTLLDDLRTVDVV